MWNLNNELDRNKAKKYIDYSWNQLQPFRRVRREMVKLYVGNNYGKIREQMQREQLVAQVQQIANIYETLLVASRPRCRVGTNQPELMQFAKRFEINLNNLLRIIEIEDTLRHCVQEAFWCMGICKVGMGSSTGIRLDNDVYTDPGFPFASHVSLDRYFHDMLASSRRELRFAGDYYDVDHEVLENDDLYDKKARKELCEQLRHESDNEEKVSDLGRSIEARGDFHKSVKLMDIYVPSEQKIYTIDAEMRQKPLAVADYSGNPGGPYKYLSFCDVVDNTMPIGALASLEPLTRVYNSAYRKLVNQLGRQKQNTIYEPGAVDDAKQFINATDGQAIAVKDAEAVKQISRGGVDQNAYAFAVGLGKLIDRQSGNATLLGGLGASTDTVGQENIIKEQSGSVISKMQSKVVKFTSEICTELGWHLWHDQVGMKASINLAEYGLPEMFLDRSWNPGQREGDITQYSFDVEPYSMAYRTPGQRIGTIMQTIEKFAIPLSMSPLGQQAGMQIDMQELFYQLSDLQDEPILRKIVKFNNMPVQGNPEPERLKPKQPKGEYIHRSVKGNKDPNSEDESLQMMSSAGRDNNAA